MILDENARSYLKSKCAVFRKTKEQFGALSNMASGFPLRINGRKIWSAEALYLACRFPDNPDVQRLVLAEYSPMTAKMKSKRFRLETRSDWMALRVKIM